MIIKRPQIAHIPPYSPPMDTPPRYPPYYTPRMPPYIWGMMLFKKFLRKNWTKKGYDAVQKISGEKMIKKKGDAIFQNFFSGKFFGFKKRGCHISKNFSGKFLGEIFRGCLEM